MNSTVAKIKNIRRLAIVSMSNLFIDYYCYVGRNRGMNEIVSRNSRNSNPSFDIWFVMFTSGFILDYESYVSFFLNQDVQ